MSMLHMTSYSSVMRFGRVVLLSIIVAAVWVATIHSPVYANSSIRIETVSEVPLGGSVEISVIIDVLDNNHEINGFDLLIIYHQTGLILNDVQPGQLLNDCQWEYFVYQTPDDLDSIYNGQYTRIVAVADINNGTNPICNLTQPGELFSMHFNTTSNPQFRCEEKFISFFWNDCGDNMFSLANTTDVLISDSVWAYNNEHYTIYDANFPSWSGTPNSCLDLGDSSSQLIRGMDFHGGSVEYSCADANIDSEASVYISFPNRIVIGSSTEATIYIENSGANPLVLAGFDLTLDFDPNVFSVDTAQLSNQLEQCQWEYFRVRDESNTDCGNICQGGLIRVVAIADIGNQTIPICFIDSTVALATINFNVALDSSLVYQTSLVNWFWLDCGDNTFSSNYGDSLIGSNQVYDAFGKNITTNETSPSYGGMADECIIDSLPHQPIRMINFHSGETAYFEYPQDYRGDINVNFLPYEIADLLLFNSYFLNGLDVFVVNTDAQVVASDVNANGSFLGLDDYVYLYRVVIGDAYPIRNGDIIPMAPYDTVIIIQDDFNKSISFEFDDSLSALYFQFDSPISLYGITDQISDRISFDSITNAVLIAPNLFNNIMGVPTIEPGVLFKYNGEANIIEIQAAYNGVSNLQPVLVFEDSTIIPDTSLASVSITTTSHATIGYDQYAFVHFENSLSNPLALGAFEFQIGFDSTKLKLDTLVLGTYLASLGWEVIGYRVEPNAECLTSECQNSILTGTIFADYFDFSNPPKLLDTSAMLFEIVFNISDDHFLARQTAELNWVWINCSFNSFTNVIGDSMIVSNHVFDAYGNNITDLNATFPTYGGLPQSCTNDSLYFKPLHLVDFHSGVTAEFDLPWDYRGDINLNFLAYEIADYFLFNSYFIYGLSVFNVNLGSQIIATDVNADGNYYGLDDYVYLYRVIIGDTLPLMAPSQDTIPVEFKNEIIPLAAAALYDTVNITHDVDLQTISVDYSDSLSALYFVFDAPIFPDSIADQIKNRMSYDSLSTKILISPDFDDNYDGVPTIDPGFLFSYTGQANLLEVKAAYNGLSYLQTNVSINDTTSYNGCCRLRGNVDGNNELIPNISDLLYMVNYMFRYDSPPPPCLDEADVNGVENISDISDLLYLVNYIFIYGPPPVPCPIIK